MASPQEYLAQAAKYIGISGDQNIFNHWYWVELNGYDYDPGWAWCACFQSYVGVHDLGMSFNPSSSAAGVAWQGMEVADEDVQPGDWVLFNWDGRQDFGWADHIGVVEWSDINGSGYFGTIEGNCNDCVCRCTRYNNGSYATKFFRPPYSEQSAAKWIWNEDEGKWWYRHADGTWTENDWEKINGEWYLFDADGWMLTGWQYRDGNWYYLKRKSPGEGRMLTGWQKIVWNGRSCKFYFEPDGAMVSDCFKLIEGSWYAFDSDGVLVTDSAGLKVAKSGKITIV